MLTHSHCRLPSNKQDMGWKVLMLRLCERELRFCMHLAVS